MNKSEIQNQALDILFPLSRATVVLSVGLGKTYLALQHLNMLYDSNNSIRILVAAPKKSIVNSWYDEAKKYNLEFLLNHITFTTYLSLKKASKNYDVLYLDEVHNLLESHDNYLGEFTGRIYGLTGTPPRFKSSTCSKLLEKYCPIVYEYKLDKAIENKIINSYNIYVHFLDLSTSKNLLVKTKNSQFYTNEVLNYKYYNSLIDNASSPKNLQFARIMRMKALQSYKSKEIYTQHLLKEIKEKCIIFANTREQADRLCSYSYHSDNPDSELNLLKFKSGIISQLSCVLQLNEGVNIPNLKEGIIMHSYGNEKKLSQRMGRLCRLNPESLASIHILCYRETVDETWVQAALSEFNPEKIFYINQ